MMHTTAKRVRTLCSMVVMLVLVASIIAVPALALDTGIYTAKATPSYRDPSKGTIEDSGGASNEVLGQSMTESVTHNKALVEVDQNGDTFVTVRLKLMDNIENVVFQVDGKEVPATCMQEDVENNTADYRMQVNSKDSLIRASMHVTAMGRDVVYFITLSNLQFGADDFVTSIDAPMTGEMPVETEKKPEQPQTTPNTTESNDSSAAKTDEPEGLQEYDAAGNNVAENGHSDANSSTSNSTIWVVVGVVAVAAVGFCVWYFGFFRKKH